MQMEVARMVGGERSKEGGKQGGGGGRHRVFPVMLGQERPRGSHVSPGRRVGLCGFE